MDSKRVDDGLGERDGSYAGICLWGPEHAAINDLPVNSHGPA